jgi:hypothetical protein
VEERRGHGSEKKGGEGKTTMQGGEVQLFLTRREQSDLLCAGMTKKAFTFEGQ